MTYDFHTHTLLSDGELLPIELIRRAFVLGYKAIAITDHVSPSNLESVIASATKDCELAEKHWDIIAIAGVELTHIPVKAISKLAKEARKKGAKLVVLHGETPIEPVEKGTNYEGLRSDIDILAHPGYLSLEEAEIAYKNNIFIELTKRGGHSIANNHIAEICKKANCKLLLSTDAHSEKDLLREGEPRKICLKLGLGNEINRILVENPMSLLKKLGYL
ncbi:MAG: histidinol phosphate phosphatase domain-containing protein [Candidatus Thermoplasmatota archaeon]|nr:histidinol phosphate phosphatase domain-containing protein [Candidatus Thermoplasmatota archaeon]MDI6888017.1 histidinol phosphate phosphatase domain-containing protein [Candidatus Thermoplasmatota archaeon]